MPFEEGVMVGDMAARWSKVPASTIDRRDLLVIGAGAAAALLIGGSEPLRRAISASTASPADIVRSFPKSRWDWTVELAVLYRIDADRAGALALLWAALELDLDPAQAWRQKPALRLYDLYAAASDAAGRAALAALVRSHSKHQALLARATLWSDASRPAYPRTWRTVGPDQQPLGIYLAEA
jgi:hypothetical protein